ncbi:MAG TPA: M28 family metallopeptidase [Phycisphaerae bacterium]|nr:M28 family metallopeptidase [Phycisphaerae bacterium]
MHPRRIMGIGLLIAVACALPAAGAVDVWDVVGQVSGTSYRDYLDNGLFTHAGDNRGFANVADNDYLPTAQHDAARDNILSLFAGLGLEASLDPFTFTKSSKDYLGCNNVLGVLPGRVHPERLYFVGGHYDSVENPGADDNASGVAGVMEAARVLSQYPFECTIVFAAWDGEERGLQGSWHWVNTNDEGAVDGVANLDMIAYNHDGDGDGQGDDAVTAYGEATWRGKWVAALGRYAPGMTVHVRTSSVAVSDHWPFQDRGRPAGGIIEGVYTGSLANPNYHKLADSVDTPGYIDYGYAVELLGSAVGLIAEEAGLLTPGDIDVDGDVDEADFALLEAHFGMETGATWLSGDFDADGDVDHLDYLALKRDLQATPPPEPAPEPGSFALLMPLALALLPRRPHPEGPRDRHSGALGFGRDRA